MESHLNNMDMSGREERVRTSSEYEEPQGELEQAIAQLWKDLFHLDRVGRNDNFFELGGNSILGMDLSEMLTTRLSLEVPILAIFQRPTIAEIAQVMESQ
jgi:hypothetical protein